MTRRRERERTKIAQEAPLPLRVLVEEKPKPETLEELRAEILTALDRITADAGVVRVLIQGRQYRMVDLDADTREAMAAQRAEDRRAAAYRDRAQEEPGHAWFVRPDETSLLHGPTAAPGDATAISLDAEIIHTLRQVVLDLADRQKPVAVPHLAGLARVHELANRIQTLLAATDESHVKVLQRSHQALAAVVERIGQLVDGHGQRTHHPWPCPHCGLETLVVLHDWQIIRCERTRTAKRHEPCVCSGFACECKRDPIGFRHTWYGPASQLGHTPSWQHLAERVGLAHAADTTPTKKNKKRKKK